ncbi:MAG: RNA polymerase sigma factor [Gammaproteobacteria bacterium]|nr:RNA polymerase sigma factor [Gammaproteobacteria bacterium]
MISFLQKPEKRFESIVQPYLRDLFKRAYRLTQCQHDAEELVQDLLIKLFEKRSEINRIENIEGWMMRSLYHLYIDRWRKESRNPVSQSENITSEALYTIECSELGPLQEVNRFKIHQQIHAALTSLNAEQQLLIVMHDMEGYSLPELANNLGIPLGTLKSRLHRARNNIKKKLKLVEPFEQKLRLQV